MTRIQLAAVCKQVTGVNFNDTHSFLQFDQFILNYLLLEKHVIHQRQEEEEDFPAERHLRGLRLANKKVSLCFNDKR